MEASAATPTSTTSATTNQGGANSPQELPVLERVPIRQEEEEETMDLFLEALDATMASVSIFLLADLRTLARNKLCEEDARHVLTLPLQGEQGERLCHKHRALLQKCRSFHVTDLLLTYRERTKRERRRGLELYHVHDENADKECVYYIGRDCVRNVILLVFRGSITPHDWGEDIKLISDPVPNPLFGTVPGQPETIGLHRGFRNYLHGSATPLLYKLASKLPIPPLMGRNGKTTTTTTGGNHNEPTSDGATDSSKMQVILEQLREMKQQFPDHPIVCTGHSLGAALSLVAALAVAADPVLGQQSNVRSTITPVTCIAVANPKVGDKSFTNALLYLEKTRKLRCLCIRNTYDIVTLTPPNLTRSDAGFWHPGYRLLLYHDAFDFGRSQAPSPQLVASCSCCRRPCLRPPRQPIFSSKWIAPLLRTPKATLKGLNRHDYRLYIQRVLASEQELSRIRLTDVYARDFFWADHPPATSAATAAVADEEQCSFSDAEC